MSVAGEKALMDITYGDTPPRSTARRSIFAAMIVAYRLLNKRLVPRALYAAGSRDSGTATRACYSAATRSIAVRARCYG